LAPIGTKPFAVHYSLRSGGRLIRFLPDRLRNYNIYPAYQTPDCALQSPRCQGSFDL